MRKTFGILAAAGAACVAAGVAVDAQRGGPAAPLYKLDEAFLQWPLLPANQKYGAIDGHRLHEHVEALTAISRRYRDQGHPQFWGRIIGTSADTDTQQWLMQQYQRIGLSDVHLQTFDMVPQWMPQRWAVSVSGGGKTVTVDAAQPAYGTAATPAGGLDLEAVWVGVGSEADYIGRDVRGKAVWMFSEPLPGSWRHTATQENLVRLAEQKGAAAIFLVIGLPGNIRTQLYPTGTSVPTFSVGMEDGTAVRELIGASGARAPHANIQLDVQMVPNLTTATVWGTLPGATDETIYILGHRDGWFEAGTDNASGVATMVGLAEYFARIPQAERRRTIVFLGTSGHHNSSNYSGTYLLEHRDELFGKTALMINAEHTSTMQTYLLGEAIRNANMHTGLLWYAGGPSRPKLQDAAVKAFRDFGVVTYAEPERAAPGGEMSRLWPYVPGVQGSDYNMYFHSDAESAATVPWTGLESITRAYAKIIDAANLLDLADLQRPPEVQQPAGR